MDCFGAAAAAEHYHHCRSALELGRGYGLPSEGLAFTGILAPVDYWSIKCISSRRMIKEGVGLPRALVIGFF